MGTDKYKKIKGMLRRKILPILTRLNGSVPDDSETAIIESSKISIGVKGSKVFYFEELQKY
ncbi:MAG: hypothetical protein ACHQIM_00335 [Sphingobacteriales bacterium]